MSATISHAVDRIDNRSEEYLPESDGRPMAETDRRQESQARQAAKAEVARLREELVKQQSSNP